MKPIIKSKIQEGFLDSAASGVGKVIGKGARGAKDLVQNYGSKALDYAKKNPLAIAGALGGGAIGGLTGGLGGAYVGARQGQSLGSLAQSGLGALKKGAQAFNADRKSKGLLGTVKDYGSKAKDFIKNDALKLANQMGGKAIDYVRENPKKALSRLAGGVAGGFLGGTGGAFTGQAAGGRIAQGVENLRNTAKKFNTDRKTSGVLGAIKGNALDAGKAALDIGAGAAAFGNMFGKYKDQVAKDDAYNRETQNRLKAIGKRSVDTEEDLSVGPDYEASKAGYTKISQKQFYDPRTGSYVNTDVNDDNYGLRSNSPFTKYDPYGQEKFKPVTFRGGAVQDLDNLDPVQRANILQNKELETFIRNKELNDPDNIYDKMGTLYSARRGIKNDAGDVQGSLAGLGMGAAGTAVDGINSGGPRRPSGRTATDYARLFGRAGKRFFNRFRR